VLILPILIVITFLAVAMVKLGHLRLDMQISARNNAFAAAYGWSGAMNIDNYSKPYLPGTQITHPWAFAGAGSNFHDVGRTGEPRFQALHQASITPTAASASTDYVGPRALGGWKLTVREQFAVAAAPIWEREQIPLGYDQYLKDRLHANSLVVRIPGTEGLADIGFDLGDLYSGYADEAVPDVFPKAR
jgi:hypothetical protein